jgi:hypothetical protein
LRFAGLRLAAALRFAGFLAFFFAAIVFAPPELEKKLFEKSFLFVRHEVVYDVGNSIAIKKTQHRENISVLCITISLS